MLIEEAIDLVVGTIGFGRGCGHVIRQNTKWMNRRAEWLLG